MADDDIEPLLVAISNSEDVRWSPEWFELRACKRRDDWAALRSGSARILRSKSKHLRIALWWAEANARLEGLKGLAAGIRLLSALWTNFTDTEVPEEELAKAVADALETNLLQVSLADKWFTFTTVVNARQDPELHLDVQREVGRMRERWAAFLPQIDFVEDALKELEAQIGSVTTEEAFHDFARTLVDMRRTMSGWIATPAQQPEERRVDKAVLNPAERGLDYRIYLLVEGVTGESATAHHSQWIEALSYKHSVTRSTDSENRPELIFEVEKYVDRASPALHYAVHTGRRFDKVIVDVCRESESAERFLRVEMTDAAISEMRQSAESSCGRRFPLETVAFDYRRINWTYTQLRPEDAAPVGNTSSTWTAAPAGQQERV